jgi:hypothetical protein
MSDLQFTNHGSLIGITPLTDAGKEWVEIHVSYEPWAVFGRAIMAEPRYAYDILQGARADGLECE